MNIGCIMLHCEHDKKFEPVIEFHHNGPGDPYCTLGIDGLTLFLTPKQVDKLRNCLDGTSDTASTGEAYADAPSTLEPVS